MQRSLSIGIIIIGLALSLPVSRGESKSIIDVICYSFQPLVVSMGL